MATSAVTEESIITLRDSCDIQTESVPRVQESYRCQVKHSSRRRKWPLRTIGSRSLLLILTRLFILNCSEKLTLVRMTYSYAHLERVNPDYPWIKGEAMLGIVSRYKLVSCSLKAMWLISIVGIYTICEKCLPVAETTISILQLFLFATPQFLLFGVFIVTAVPLAIDQITGGSNANISALLVWLGWGRWAYFCGIAVAAIAGSVFNNCTNFNTSQINMIMSLLPVLLLSVGLILDFHFHHKLVKEPVTVNPVSLISKS